MTAGLALLPALIALLAWGFGDFAIQRATRAVGTLAALFFIGAFGAVVLFPFAAPELPALVMNQGALAVLVITVVVTCVTAVIELEGLRRGKLSVVEPVLSFEIVVTMAIGIVALNDRVSLPQGLLAFVVFIGILLTAIHREPRHWWNAWRRRPLLEAGVLLAIISTILMSVTNVFTGVASQATNPVLTIWFIHTSLALFVGIWMAGRGQFALMLRDGIRHWRPVLAESILDNTAWLAYAWAVIALPISITIAITESYIAISSLLGIIWNHERLRRHQYVGAVLSLAAAIALAVSIGSA